MFSAVERSFVEITAQIANANPFRAAVIRQLEDKAHAIDLPVEAQEVEMIPERPRIGLIVAKAARLLARIKKVASQEVVAEDLKLHAQLVRFVLYFQFRNDLQRSVEEGLLKPQPQPTHWYKNFRRRFQQLSFGKTNDPLSKPGHVIACFFQIRRAYHLIQSKLVGSSQPIQQLRAAAWESVFTTDMERYGRLLFDRIQDISTLIVGPSGTGKELVARAVGLSRYIPFDEQNLRFKEPLSGAFHGVNLSALPPTLIESELFGHARGSFTGAALERKGWFEICRDGHTVFLDEIGELEPELQVKLLRVLQERTFQRIGEYVPRKFDGKVIAATNRNLATELSERRFRPDLYYRICSDVIQTPTLRSQIDDAPEDLDLLVNELVIRQVGRPVPEISERVSTHIREQLPNYHWPGNVRELEQCIRSILVRDRYLPLDLQPATSKEAFAQKVTKDWLSGEELLNEYARLIYHEVGTYSEVARILGIDRRTAQRRIHP